jgi:hypothetical protein
VLHDGDGVVVQLLQIGKLINLAGQGGFSGGGPSDPAEIAVNAVDFDGTNDYLLRGGSYTGAADGNAGSIVFWAKMGGGDGVSRTFFNQEEGDVNDTTLALIRNAANQIWLFGRNSAGDNVLWVETDFTLVVADGWTCILASWDLSAALNVQIYKNDTPASLAVTAKVEGLLEHTSLDNVSIGSNVNGGNKVNACLAQVYFNTAEFIDFSVEANRRKFISSGGNPVDLGADGSGPTGTAPICFLSGATASWHTNKGSGGGMTENGALTDCATSPSAFPVIFTAAFVAAFT